jgi:hypothetical protein
MHGAVLEKLGVAHSMTALFMLNELMKAEHSWRVE